MISVFNPHKNHLYGLVRDRIDLGEANISKLNYIFNVLVQDSETRLLIDRQFFPDNRITLKSFIRNLQPHTKQVENWLSLNNWDFNLVHTTWSSLTADDIILLNSKDLRYPKLRQRLLYTKASRLVLATNHYCHHPQAAKDSLSGFQGTIDLISELPVKQKPVYREFLPTNSRETSFGYVIDVRFRSKVPIENRHRQAIITGSYSTNRKRSRIVENYLKSKNLTGSQHYRAQIDQLTLPTNSKLTRLLNCRNRGMAGFGDKVKNYYSFDLCEVLNSHMFCVIPPDSFEVAPQLLFEAMGCGNIIITMPDPSLEQLGIFEGVHYIGYDFKENIDNINNFVDDLTSNADDYFDIHVNALNISANFRSDKITQKVTHFFSTLDHT